MRADDVYERIKDITEFPVFRFDWFFTSRSPQELQRRCSTLLRMIGKEAEAKQQEEVKTKVAKGKVWADVDNLTLFVVLSDFDRNALLTRCRKRRRRRRNHLVRPRRPAPPRREGSTRRTYRSLAVSARGSIRGLR
jgi:hypothetical protein